MTVVTCDFANVLRRAEMLKLPEVQAGFLGRSDLERTTPPKSFFAFSAERMKTGFAVSVFRVPFLGGSIAIWKAFLFEHLFGRLWASRVAAPGYPDVSSRVLGAVLRGPSTLILGRVGTNRVPPQEAHRWERAAHPRSADSSLTCRLVRSSEDTLFRAVTRNPIGACMAVFNQTDSALSS